MRLSASPVVQSWNIEPQRVARRSLPCGVADAMDAQWQSVQMEHFASDPRPVVSVCRAAVSGCDLVILVQAFRGGWVPSPVQGGDGETSMTGLEIASADEQHKPVLAFLADENWPGRLWEEAPKARAWVHNFRSGLNRSATFFSREDNPDVPAFKGLIRQELASYRMLGCLPVTARKPSIEQFKLRLPTAAPPSLILFFALTNILTRSLDVTLS